MRFCWAEWPYVGPEEAIKHWHAARMAWHEEHAVITADRVRESVLGSWVDIMRAKRVAHLHWQGSQGTGPACSEQDCNGADRCILRR